MSRYDSSGRKRNGARRPRYKSKRIYYQIIYFLIIALLLSGGYTISYFISQGDLSPNEFTAGTVAVDAGDAEGKLVICDSGDNTWSPGGCRDLELAIKNTGSKKAYARARFAAEWKAQYHTNIAGVTADYIPSGQTEPRQIKRETWATYSYGDYAGEGEGQPPPPLSPHWFTNQDQTSSLGFISAYIVEQTGGGGGSPSSPAAPPAAGDPPAGKTVPEVNGLFYGDGDYLLYSPIATVPTGTTLYAYLDEKADGARTLYVALVVSRAVNDNVFDSKDIAPYRESADWPLHRAFKRLTDSEFMGFRLMGHDITTDKDVTWEWQQCYAYQQDENGAPLHWKKENNTTPTWASDHTAKAGEGTPPPGYVSSSSLVWNLNNYALNRLEPGVPKWDVTLGGTRVWETWKSPFDPAYPNDVTKVDGYPATGQITFSQTYGWEWPMVYEFSVDMTNYSPYYMELGNISSHHSPPKSGDVNEPFDGGYKVPGVSIVKEVSLDEGATWHSGSPWPELPDPLPEGFAPQFRFTVKNTGDIELTGIVVNDDVLGVVGNLASLAPGASHAFPVYTDYDWEAHRAELDPGNVSFQLAGGMDDWIKGEDGYFYCTEPVGPGDVVILRVRACVAEGLEEMYKTALLSISSYAETVQATHGAVDDVWPGHPPLASIPTGPSLRVSKWADRGSAAAGDTINYTIRVTNNGNVTLSNIAVTDEMLGISDSIASLVPGASQVYNGSYTVKAGDTGTLENTAAASATHEGHYVSAAGSVFVTVVQANPSLGVVKQANRSSAAEGDRIVYTIIVTNNGNVVLEDITVTDAMLDFSTDIVSLAPGNSRYFSGNYTADEADFPGPLVNTVIAAADYRGTPVSAQASVSVELELITLVPFSSLEIGDYVEINGVLFQKIGDDRVLLRGLSGTANWNNAGQQGSDYYQGFTSVAESSGLLTQAQAGQLNQQSIRAIGSNWWNSDQHNNNRGRYINESGDLVHDKKEELYGVRPALNLVSGLFVSDASGTGTDPYILIIPD